MALKLDDQVMRGLAVIFYFMIKLSGQLPYNLSMHNPAVSRWWLLYSIIFTAVLAVTFIVEGLPMLRFKVQDQIITGLNSDVAKVHFISKIIVAVAICVSDILNSKKVIKLFTSFSKIYNQLLKLEKDDRAYRTTFILFIVRTLLQIAAHTISNILKYLYIIDQDLNVGWFPIFILMLPSIVISICANKHCAIIIALSYGLSKLNGALDVEVKLINKRMCRTRFQRIQLHTMASEKIDDLSNLHKQLYRTIHHINDLYAGRILLVVSYLFINIISELYFAANHIARRAKGLQPTPEVIELFGVVNLILFSAELYFIVKASQSLKDAREETGIIIHNIYRFQLDDRLKQSVESLSLHLRLSDVNFTPMGLFSLDRSALYQMMHAISTFLIILCQFKMAEDYENRAIQL